MKTYCKYIRYIKNIYISRLACTIYQYLLGILWMRLRVALGWYKLLDIGHIYSIITLLLLFLYSLYFSRFAFPCMSELFIYSSFQTIVLLFQCKVQFLFILLSWYMSVSDIILMTNSIIIIYLVVKLIDFWLLIIRSHLFRIDMTVYGRTS